MAANRNFCTISSFTRYTHNLNSSIIDFRNFLFHQTFDHFRVASANKDIDTTWVIFYLVDKYFNSIMRLEHFSWNLVLLRQLCFDRTKIDIDKSIVKALHRSTHDFIFMFFISVIGDGARLLTHFFHDGLFGRLSCYTTKFSWCFFKLDLIPQLISRANGQGILQADF